MGEAGAENHEFLLLNNVIMNHTIERRLKRNARFTLSPTIEAAKQLRFSCEWSRKPKQILRPR